MTVRMDLMHLTPEALAQAANVGVVKRAVRELEGGYRPECTLESNATLIARFSDAITVTWPEGRALAQAECTCGAAKVCRHRIIAALAYREQAAQSAGAPTIVESPATVSEEQLRSVIPVSVLTLAREQLQRGFTADVRTKAAGEPCDTVRLPAATVRFWAGAAIAAARCDCIRATACEHVALGVWAFQAAAQRDPTATALQVHLGSVTAAVQLDRVPYLQLVESLLRHGVATGIAHLVQPLTRALNTATDSGATWLRYLLAAIEQWSAAYANRSALYDVQQGVRLLSELALRLAAGVQPGRAKQVLGIGEAAQVELDRLRLTCFGARTGRDGEQRHTRIVLADVDTATQMVLTKDWAVKDAQQEIQVRAAERLAPGVRLEQLAQGQLLAQQAHRLADGTIRLAKQRSSQNSVLPQAADWDMFSLPLRYTRIQQLCEHQRAQPTQSVLPRHAARQFVVFTPTQLEHLCYDPNEQLLSVCLCDADDEIVVVQRMYEAHVHHALDALAAACLGECGKLRHVAGVLRWQHGVPVLEPWAVACDRVIVPDFAQPTGALAKVPLGSAAVGGHDAIGAVLSSLREQLAALVHHGVRHLPRTWSSEATSLLAKLASLSLHALEQRLQQFVKLVAEAALEPATSQLATPALELMALLQLHEDAQAVVALE